MECMKQFRENKPVSARTCLAVQRMILSVGYDNHKAILARQNSTPFMFDTGIEASIVSLVTSCIGLYFRDIEHLLCVNNTV